MADEVTTQPMTIDKALEAVANKVAKIVDDFSKLTVEMRIAQLDDASAGLGKDVEAGNYPLVARTEFQADGDATYLVPVDANKQVHSLYTLHQQQVETALKYRADMIASVMQAIQGLASKL